MKRFALILTLALCLGLLAGCGTEDVLGNMMGARVPEPTNTPAPTEQPIWTPPGTAAVTATPVPSPLPAPGAAASGGVPNYASLTVDDCVEDGWTYPGVIAHIKLDCPGAAAINAAIDEAFVDLAEDPMFDVHYECAIAGNRILSILMVEQMNDSLFHTGYNLDMATGQAVTGPEILALLGQDEAAVKTRELETLGEEFTHQFGFVKDQTDPDFYDQQYARTTAIGNADTENLWFSTDGQLYFPGRLYGMAGAEYYEIALPTGVFF